MMNDFDKRMRRSRRRTEILGMDEMGAPALQINFKHDADRTVLFLCPLRPHEAKEGAISVYLRT